MAKQGSLQSGQQVQALLAQGGKIELDPVWTLLANSSGRFVELLKSRNAGRSKRNVIKPVDKTNQIDRCGDGQMLQMSFGQPHIARTAQVKGPHPLRNGRLNPPSQSILVLEGFSLLKLACCLERGMLRLWSDDHRSAWIFAGGLNTIGKTWARLAIRGGKLDLDELRMRLPTHPAPAGTRFPLRTGCEPLLPIQDKLTCVNAIRGISLFHG
jgi:hypothetical protein